MKDIEYEYDISVLLLAYNLIAGKWAISILWHLNKDKKRYNELCTYFKYTSRSVFTKQLHKLEDEGLIKRKVYDESPIRVEYSLTEIGEKLINVFEVMIEWSKEYIKSQKEEGMLDIDFIEQTMLTDKYRAYKDHILFKD